MSPQLITSSPNRALAARIREKVGAGYIIQPNTIKVNLPVVPTNNQYLFDLYKVSGSDHPLDNKLDRNDAFFITHMALHIFKQDESTTPKQYANGQAFTYPDPNFFVGVLSSWNEWKSLQTVYNGLLTLSTQNAERIKDFPTENFLFVPNRPYLLNSTDPDNLPEYGPTLEERGFFELPEMLILNGQDNNDVKLTLGPGNTAIIDGSVNAAGTAVNTRNVVALKLQGFSVIGGARAVTSLF